jgi:hypothetical protein
MKQKIYLITLSCILLFSCRRELSETAPQGTIVYDIFPVLGQSNTHSGAGLDFLLDKTDPRIKQLGRFGSNDYKIIPAIEPLDHFTKAEGCNGFAMTFAMNYLQNYWLRDREILLIPGSKSASSFRNYEWRKGDTLYNDIVRRVKYVLEKYPGSEVKGFLWHQGESDVYWGRYYGSLLDRMITNMRRDIAGAKGDSIPFIVGGFLPYWADLTREARVTDSVIAETPTRLPYIGYASARSPFIIVKPDYSSDNIHFDAAGQRELGKRYFEAYQKIKD